MVERVAAALVPFYPDCAEPAQRLALLPAQMQDLFKLEGYHVSVGRGDEIVLIVVQPAADEERAVEEADDNAH